MRAIIIPTIAMLLLAPAGVAGAQTVAGQPTPEQMSSALAHARYYDENHEVGTPDAEGWHKSRTAWTRYRVVQVSGCMALGKQQFSCTYDAAYESSFRSDPFFSAGPDRPKKVTPRIERETNIFARTPQGAWRMPAVIRRTEAAIRENEAFAAFCDRNPYHEDCD